MISKWYELKEKAIVLRKGGSSIREAEKTLGIPRSTLSGWFAKIKLSNIQTERLAKKQKIALTNARLRAKLWHSQQKEMNILAAKIHSEEILSAIDVSNPDTLELALAMLYLGEGSKFGQTSMGNSNPLILKFFVKSLVLLYKVDISRLKCDLHLRSDQSQKEMKKYWSEQLGLPIQNFTFYVDKRTIKSRTKPDYKGVCVVRVGQIAIQRRILFLSQGFCEKILGTRTLSSLGRATF